MDGEPLIILLVEDNPDHAELIVRSFEEHRVANKIFHVLDGEAALDYLFHRRAYADPKSSPPPHVILLDLRLPKIDGLEVLKEIKGFRATASHSGRGPHELRIRARHDGAYNSHVNSYLVKPVDFDKFSKLMDDLGFYWLVWNRKPFCDRRLQKHPETVRRKHGPADAQTTAPHSGG